MPVTSFEDKDSRYAYNCIRDFFDCYDLCGAVADIDNILKSAISHKTYKKGTPYSVLYFMEKLEELCAAAFTIHQSHSARAGGILKELKNGVPDVAALKHFAGRQDVPTIWEFFPRHLTARQYLNPYKAIRKFTACRREQKWKELFKELTEYALGDQSINDVYPPYNILTVRLRLLQLIEACQLLDVRTNLKEEPTGQKKKKKSK